MNIAGLQLSRNAARTPEFAIRSALGVSRWRLVQQLLTESVVLVITGSVVGVAAGAVLMRLFTMHLPAALLRVERPHIDGLVLIASLAVAMVVGLLTGLIPAVRSTRASLVVTGGLSRGRTRLLGRTFTVVQIALALTLLTLSAMVLQSLYGLLHTPLGFDPTQLQSCSVDMGWGTSGEERHRLYEQIENALAATPGVLQVGSINALPLESFSFRNKFDIAGQPPTPGHDAVVAEGRSFSPGYVRAMRIPLLAGRLLTLRDAEPNMPAVTIVNQTFASRYFAGRNPIGQRLIVPVGVVGSATIESEIVGVIGDVRGTGGALAAPVQPEVYGPESGGWPHQRFVIRSTIPSATLEPQLRRIVAGLNGSASVSHFTTLSTALDASVQQPRLNAALLTAFAALSLLLVVIGVYGLVAFDVAQRTRELGLRLALGASRGGLLSLLLLESTRVLLVGLALGAAGSWVAFHLLAATLVDADAHRGPLLLGTAVVLALAVLMATLVPARRASMVDPMQALRTE